jgi:hypothetical protein
VLRDGPALRTLAAVVEFPRRSVGSNRGVRRLGRGRLARHELIAVLVLSAEPRELRNATVWHVVKPSNFRWRQGKVDLLPLREWTV